MADDDVSRWEDEGGSISGLRAASNKYFDTLYEVMDIFEQGLQRFDGNFSAALEYTERYLAERRQRELQQLKKSLKKMKRKAFWHGFTHPFG